MNNTTLFTEAKETLEQLSTCIANLNAEDYTLPLEILNGGTIGQHTRHILELFQQAINGSSQGVINYDNRQRVQLLQTSIETAIEEIAYLKSNLEQPDKPLKLESLYLSESSTIQTTYYREVMYNVDHCVHHLALIRIGLKMLGVAAPENMGVSKATRLKRQQAGTANYS